MIKVYYKSNTAYGADELNNIVKNLRTDGRLHDIANCLKVSKGTGLTLNIADGVGYVDGCGIEVSGGHSLTLPSVNGTYYIYMDVTTQSDHVVSADIVQSTTTPDNANSVLATAVVSSGAIMTVTNTDISSHFRGQTNYPYTIYSGTKTFTTTLGALQARQETISVPADCKKVKCYIGGGTVIFEVGAEGINAIYGKGSQYQNYEWGYPFMSKTGELSTDWRIGTSSGSWLGLGVCGDPEIHIREISFAAGTLTIIFDNKSATATKNLNCKIDWEAW